MLLKKQRLSKKPILTHCPGMSLKQEEYYGPADLICGKTVQVYNRECLIYDCDRFTKDWYSQNMGVTQSPVDLPKAQARQPEVVIPAYNGYGSPEDSLGSVFSLRPKAPKVDMKKMFKQDMHVLRFESSLVSTDADDISRRFIISFYCGDDTIQVYEVCDKNSGRIGGRFMERQKQNNPETGVYYTEKDFKIGQIVHLAGFTFRLVKCDEYTEKYMEDNAAVFPESSIEAIIEKIRQGASSFPNLQEYAIHLMKVLDKNNNGFVEMAEFLAGLESLNITASKQEVHALLRRFDLNGDGKISMEEFYNTLAANF